MVKYGKLLVTVVTYKSNQNYYLICMIQVKKGHSSIDNVIKNTPTTLDMFLQTNFDKIKQTAMKIIYLEPCNYGVFCIGLNQLMYKM